MDQELIKVLKRLGAQLVTQQAMLVKMEKTLRGLAMTPQGAVRIVPFGVFFATPNYQKMQNAFPKVAAGNSSFLHVPPA